MAHGPLVLKGRFIGENIRLVYDLLNNTEQKHIPGLLMLIDFEKALENLFLILLNSFTLETQLKIGLKLFTMI